MLKRLRIVENSNYENDEESMGEYLVVDNEDVIEWDGDFDECEAYVKIHGNVILKEDSKLQLMINTYNKLDLIRHNLYKKRSARFGKAITKVYPSTALMGKLYTPTARGALYKKIQEMVWSKKDEKDLLKARAALKKFGKKMSKELRKNKLIAVRLPGRNKIVEVIAKL